MPSAKRRGKTSDPLTAPNDEHADRDEAHGAEPVRQPLARPLHLAELLGDQPSYGRPLIGVLRHLMVADLPVQLGESARVGAHGPGGPVALYGQERNGDAGIESAVEHPDGRVLVPADQGRNAQSQQEHQDCLRGHTAVE